MVCSEKSLNFMIIILVYFEDYYEQNSYKQSARYAIFTHTIRIYIDDVGC